jgi:mannose-6-phosphate isomerase-like protein (cupin superfamily)
MNMHNHDRDFAMMVPHARFRVRHLAMSPGESRALITHCHKHLHWVVVSGAARVSICGQVIELFETETLDIPVGVPHRLENHGKVDLHLIEVQTGSYLEDDDLLTK